ncbi:MAG: hypothetical protein RSB64_10270, partial [Pseudomonas sp.]
MARQEINIGVAPTGAGGDTTRSGAVKINAMTAELYSRNAQLKSASNLDAGVNPGNVMLVGAGGWLGTTSENATTINDYKTGFKLIQPSTAGASDLGYQYGGMLTLSCDASDYRIGQLFFGQVPGDDLK